MRAKRKLHHDLHKPSHIIVQGLRPWSAAVLNNVSDLLAKAMKANDQRGMHQVCEADVADAASRHYIDHVNTSENCDPEVALTCKPDCALQSGVLLEEVVQEVDTHTFSDCPAASMMRKENVDKRTGRCGRVREVQEAQRTGRCGRVREVQEEERGRGHEEGGRRQRVNLLSSAGKGARSLGKGRGPCEDITLPQAVNFYFTSTLI